MKLPVLVIALMSSVALAQPAAAATKKKQAAVRPSVSTQARPALASDPTSVYVGGEYIGRDPDPNIRAYLTRNPHGWDGPD